MRKLKDILIDKQVDLPIAEQKKILRKNFALGKRKFTNKIRRCNWGPRQFFSCA